MNDLKISDKALQHRNEDIDKYIITLQKLKELPDIVKVSIKIKLIRIAG